MIETVITEIIEAENQAEKILEQANSIAKDISLSLHSESEQLQNEYALLIKNEVNKIMKTAEDEADKLSAEQAKSADLAALALVKNSEKNIQRTVEWLTEVLVKQA